MWIVLHMNKLSLCCALLHYIYSILLQHMLSISCFLPGLLAVKHNLLPQVPKGIATAPSHLGDVNQRGDVRHRFTRDVHTDGIVDSTRFGVS